MKMEISLESINDKYVITPSNDFAGETIRIAFPEKTFKNKPKSFIKSYAQSMNANVTYQPDGQIIFTMLLKDRDKMLKKFKKEAAEDVESVLNGKNNISFIKKISFDSDYKEITFYIDADIYDKASEEEKKRFKAEMFVSDCERIQLYGGVLYENIKTVVIFKNIETEKEIKRITY